MAKLNKYFFSFFICSSQLSLSNHHLILIVSNAIWLCVLKYSPHETINLSNIILISLSLSLSISTNYTMLFFKWRLNDNVYTKLHKLLILVDQFKCYVFTKSIRCWLLVTKCASKRLFPSLVFVYMSTKMKDLPANFFIENWHHSCYKISL